MVTKEEKRKIGKKNKQAGARFELLVRKDLEKKGWIVSKWANQVELSLENSEKVCGVSTIGGGFIYGRLVSAKHKFRGVGIPMVIGTGFPDFIAFSPADSVRPKIYGVEVKSNGKLDKEECAKCEWLLKNNIFSKILVASKGEKRGEIVYNEFEI